MAIDDELSRIEGAEELFELLDVAYDAALLRVNRLSVLRRFRLELSAADREGPACQGDEARRARCRDALRRAHDSFRASSALEQRLFRVLAPGEAPLVTLGRASGG